MSLIFITLPGAPQFWRNGLPGRAPARNIYAGFHLPNQTRRHASVVLRMGDIPWKRPDRCQKSGQGDFPGLNFPELVENERFEALRKVASMILFLQKKKKKRTEDGY